MIKTQNMKPLIRIHFGVIASYFVVKFMMRPFVLENEYTGLIKIFVLSYPNFCEAVAGTLIVTFGLLLLRGFIMKRRPMAFLKGGHLYLVASLLAGSYVILQEFKIHNLGGRNVYDPYDIVFSVAGLIIAYFVLVRIRPSMSIV